MCNYLERIYIVYNGEVVLSARKNLNNLIIYLNKENINNCLYNTTLTSAWLSYLAVMEFTHCCVHQSLNCYYNKLVQNCDNRYQHLLLSVCQLFG